MKDPIDTLIAFVRRGQAAQRAVQTEAGRYYGRRAPGAPLEPAPAGVPDAVICRRVADFAPAPVPEAAAFAHCQKCQAPIVYNPANPIAASSIPKICMQCAGIEPLPIP